MRIDRKKLIIGALFGAFLFAATLLAAKPDQKKADFKNKARSAVVNVAAIEAKIPPKSSECDDLQRKATNMPTIANRQAAEKCRQELDKINADLDAAVQYLSEGLYEEGSAAGLSYPEMDQILEEVKAEQEKK